MRPGSEWIASQNYGNRRQRYAWWRRISLGFWFRSLVTRPAHLDRYYSINCMAVEIHIQQQGLGLCWYLN